MTETPSTQCAASEARLPLSRDQAELAAAVAAMLADRPDVSTILAAAEHAATPKPPTATSQPPSGAGQPAYAGKGSGRGMYGCMLPWTAEDEAAAKQAREERRVAEDGLRYLQKTSCPVLPFDNCSCLCGWTPCVPSLAL